VHIIKVFLLTISAILLYAHGHAQKNQWTVNTGESIEEVLGDSVIYKYAQFMPGTVYFKYGKASRSYLNFNRIIGEMQFLAPGNDTLSVANETSIKYIIIQTDTFYFDKTYIEIIRSNATAKLGKLEIIKLADFKKEGAFGQMTSTSSIDAVNSFYTGSQTYKLTQKSAVTLRRKTIFFIGDSDNNFLPAVKKNINKMFGTKSAMLASFIKENKIAFSKEDDLIKLIDFLGKI
jgi:hypothetical protein